jgi:heme o synthase
MSLTRMRPASHTCRMRLALLRAAHPEPGGAVTVVTALLTVGAGLRFWPAVGVTATIAASQLAVGWANDAIDAGRDAAVDRPDKPVPRGEVARRTVAVAAVVAAVATVLLAVAVDLGTADAVPGVSLVALLGLVSAMSYNWPLKSTVAAPLPYAVSFAALPAFVVLAAGRPVPVWLIAAGGLLGAGAHFANVVPDLADDARTGVRGLAHRLGARGSLLVAAVLLFAVTVLLVLGPPGPPRVSGLVAGLFAAVVAVVIGYVAWRAVAARWAFRAIMLIALVDVGLLVAGGVLG